VEGPDNCGPEGGKVGYYAARPGKVMPAEEGVDKTLASAQRRDRWYSLYAAQGGNNLEIVLCPGYLRDLESKLGCAFGQ